MQRREYSAAGPVPYEIVLFFSTRRTFGIVACSFRRRRRKILPPPLRSMKAPHPPPTCNTHTHHTRHHSHLQAIFSFVHSSVLLYLL